MKCDVCGREMTHEKDGASFIGAEITVTLSRDLDPGYIEFVKALAAPYEVNHTYSVCWSCWLRPWGIDPSGGVPVEPDV